ncbi:MAG TPA: hypothetical protein DEH78_26280 [Solibacterales bacterium]|nr:hypothetical protein [Bryobacterales bacterium]
MKFRFAYTAILLAVSATASSRKEVRLADAANVAEVKLHYDRFVLISRTGAPRPALDDQKVLVLAADGVRQSVHTPGRDVKGAYSFLINDAAGSPSGRVAVSGTVWSEDGRVAEVLVLYPPGSRPVIIRTQPLMCRRMAFDADEQLWCLVSDVPKFNEGSSDYSLVAKFSPSGALLGQFVPRAGFAGKAPESDGRRFEGPARIAAGQGCVDVWLPRASTAIRLRADGTEQGRRPIDPAATEGLAFDTDCNPSRISWHAGSRTYGILRHTEEGWVATAAEIPENLIGRHELLAVKGGEAILWNVRNLLAYTLPLTSR